MSERAEEAIGDIRLVVLEFQRAQAVSADNPPGRIPGHGPTAGQRAAQLALANVVSCAELFSADALRDQPGVVENDVSSWPKQQLAWQTHVGLDLETLPAYPAVRGFNEVRNAVLRDEPRERAADIAVMARASALPTRVQIWVYGRAGLSE